MVFFLFLASIFVVRRILSQEILSPAPQPVVDLKSELRVEPQPLPPHETASLAGELSQLSNILNHWGDTPTLRRETTVSKQRVESGTKD